MELDCADREKGQTDVLSERLGFLRARGCVAIENNKSEEKRPHCAQL